MADEKSVNPKDDHPVFYDFTYARALCEVEGLRFDEAVAGKVAVAFHNAELNQDQVDRVMALHIHLVKYRLFNPATYPWWGRIALALHFLFGRVPQSPAA